MSTPLSHQPFPGAATIGSATVLLLTTLIPACSSPGEDGPRISVERATVELPELHRPSATLREAVQALDTLFLPDEGTAEVVLDAVRDVRLGRMEGALHRLLPVAGAGDSAGESAREILGQLLFHHEAWGALAGSSEGAGPLFHVFAAAQPESWSFPADSVVLPMALTSVGTPTVEVVVNGVPRHFWVDTGAGLTVISTSLADEVGIGAGAPPGWTGTSTTRRVEARGAVIGELRLGGLTVRNHPTMVLHARDLEFDSPKLSEVLTIDGILGWPILRRLDLTLDYVGGRLVLREPVERPTLRRNLFWLGYPTVAARTETGEELLLGLDTGASATSLAPGYLRATGAQTSGTRMRQTGSAGGFETTEVKILDEAGFHLGNWRVRLADVDVGAPPDGGVVALDGVIGSDLGAFGALRLDFLNGHFEMVPREALHEPTLIRDVP